MLMSIDAGLPSLGVFDVECCPRERVDDVASAQQRCSAGGREVVGQGDDLVCEFVGGKAR
jgi:hypothetical protein